jgi:hypothetical protein
MVVCRSSVETDSATFSEWNCIVLQLSILSERPFPLVIAHAVEHQDSIEVVELMLEQSSE